MFSIGFAIGLLFSLGANAENGVVPNKIVLGQTYNGTINTNSASNSELSRGWDAYLKKVNEAGGIHGRKIEIVRREDGNDPKRASEETKNLIEIDKVFAVIATLASAPTSAVLPLVEKAKIPFFAPYSGLDVLTIPVKKNVFSTRAPVSEEGAKLVEFAIGKLGLKDFGIIYQDDAFGESGRLAVNKALAERQMKFRSVTKYARGSFELEAAVEELKKAAPQVVVVWMNYKASAMFVKLASEKGLKATFVGPSNLFSNEFLSIAGKASNGVYAAGLLPLPNDTKFKVVREYIDAIKVMKGEPDPYSLRGYIDAVIFVEGLKAAGADLTRDSFIAAFEKINKLDIGGLDVTYSPTDHRGISKLFMAKVQGDKFVSVVD